MLSNHVYRKLLHLNSYLPPELAPEKILGKLWDEGPHLESVLCLFISQLGASFGVYLEVVEPGRLSYDNLKFIGRNKKGRIIPHPEKLMSSKLVDNIFFKSIPYFTGLNGNTRGAWQAGVPVNYQTPGTPPSSAPVPLGGFLLGGNGRHLHPAFFESPATLIEMLRWLAPWLGVASLLDKNHSGHSENKPEPERSVDNTDQNRDSPNIVVTDNSIHADFPDIISTTPSMKKIFETIRRVAPSDAAVLIEGESGTGKELIAKAIHQKSNRNHNPFLSENCAACPANLMEAEFFGVARGAFTGASSSKAGIFERVSGGTLFLDEIGEMSMDMQTKILRVLQEREVRRVGGTRLIPVNFRLVSATNRSLEHEIKKKQFRLDLLYRLEVIKITIPPLRERINDIPFLAKHFLKIHAGRLGRFIPKIHREGLRLLMRYHWPGNIRELQNEMWRAVAFGHTSIKSEHLSEKIRKLDLSDVDLGKAKQVFDFSQAEKDILGALMRAALYRCNGNTAHAARLLGIPRTSFYRKAKKYEINIGKALDEPIQSILSVIGQYRDLDELIQSGGSLHGKKVRQKADSIIKFHSD